MRALPIAAVLASAVLLTACTSPEHDNGDAAPAGSAAAPATSAPVSSASATSASATSAAPAGNAKDVLGPNGLGALKLGMTKEQVIATGLVTGLTGTSAGCSAGHLKGAPNGLGLVVVSDIQGVVAIEASGPAVHTPEGVHLDMPRAEMQRKAIDWGGPKNEDGMGYSRVAGNERAHYLMEISVGRITLLTLQYIRQDCYDKIPNA
ncbi:hypothetical protein [Dactylosporangium sp. NPDC051484]|uniref:hypothetical protein n=1 Tax=Dactylosporangium sp. NPDC051484 TaxID=3154942 RepID=UPI00344E5A81